MKKFLIGAAVAAVAFAATPAQAATPCQNTDISPTALDCSGFVDGNQLGGSSGMIATQQAYLAELGYIWDGVTTVESISPLNGAHTVNFNTLLVGQTIIGVHFGGGQGGPGNATAFYLLNAGQGLDTLQLNYNASSNIILYSTGGGGAVPEPGTWAMMLIGFGAAGSAISRRRRKTNRVAQIA